MTRLIQRRPRRKLEAPRSGDGAHWILVGLGIALLVVAAATALVWTMGSARFHGGRALVAPPPSARAVREPAGVAPAEPSASASGSTVNLSGAGTGRPILALGPPTQIQIPAISLQAPVVPLGQNPDGSAAVPSSTTFTGWYDPGPIPGEIGPAVIIGHVDSFSGPGVFFNLKYLLPGDVITVDDGSAPVSFRVERVVVYPKDAFPTAEVFGPTPDAELHLITCGGPFDSSIGHYEDNVVVYADATTTPPSSTARVDRRGLS